MNEYEAKQSKARTGANVTISETFLRKKTGDKIAL
jgi:hypothetical protein